MSVDSFAISFSIQIATTVLYRQNKFKCLQRIFHSMVELVSTPFTALFSEQRLLLIAKFTSKRIEDAIVLNGLL
jgi:hypothetical protein